MLIREVSLNEKETYNQFVHHITQSWEWGEAKELMGKETHRYGVFNDYGTMTAGYQITLHPLPSPLQHLKIGYLPKGPLPTPEMINALIQFGEKKNIIFYKIEPDYFVPLTDQSQVEHLQALRTQLFQLSPAIHEGNTLFTPYNFIIDLTQDPETLKANFHSKTRYNINVALKKGVKTEIRTDDEAFNIFTKLYFETCTRNKFFGHDVAYHRAVWTTLRKYNMAHILIGSYNNTPLTAWMLFTFHNTLYYPYGGSTTRHRDAMTSNLVMWDAIQFGKSLGCTSFDLWGALGPEADPSDSFFGFHRFKSGYSPIHIQNIGTFDIVVNEANYTLYNKLDKWRKKFLNYKADLRQKFKIG